MIIEEIDEGEDGFVANPGMDVASGDDSEDNDEVCFLPSFDFRI